MEMKVIGDNSIAIKEVTTPLSQPISQTFDNGNQSMEVIDTTPIKVKSATTYHTEIIEKEIPIATYDEVGKVKPDGRTISITNDGTITAFNSLSTNGHTVAKDVPQDAKFTDTTYNNVPAQQGGQDISLVTTGNKYFWDNKISQSDRLTNSEIDNIIK